MTIRIDGTNTAANPGITGTDTDTGLQFGTDEVNVVTGGSTRATVDSSGRVGIGTSNPTHPLTIKPSSDVDQLYLQQSNVNDSGWKIHANASAGDLVFFRQGSGTDTRRLAFKEDGGIMFGSDTAAANALDDYEEGTWTATIKSGSNTISKSGGQQHFTYTKIGNKVTVYFVLDGVTTSGTTGGTMRIEGLPYAPSVGSNWRTVGPPCFYHGGGLRAAHWPIYPHLNNSSATIQFYYKSGVTNNYSETTVGNVGSGTYVFFQVTYQVD